MQAKVNLPNTDDIVTVVERIFSSKRITRADQALLMSALLSKNSLSKGEQAQINRVFDGLRSGLIRVVD